MNVLVIDKEHKRRKVTAKHRFGSEGGREKVTITVKVPL